MRFYGYRQYILAVSCSDVENLKGVNQRMVQMRVTGVKIVEKDYYLEVENDERKKQICRPDR